MSNSPSWYTSKKNCTFTEIYKTVAKFQTSEIILSEICNIAIPWWRRGRGIHFISMGRDVLTKSVLFSESLERGCVSLKKIWKGIQIYLSGKGFRSVWKGVVNYGQSDHTRIPQNTPKTLLFIV